MLGSGVGVDEGAEMVVGWSGGGGGHEGTA